jgi:hypothetical protein
MQYGDSNTVNDSPCCIFDDGPPNLQMVPNLLTSDVRVQRTKVGHAKIDCVESAFKKYCARARRWLYLAQRHRFGELTKNSFEIS